VSCTPSRVALAVTACAACAAGPTTAPATRWTPAELSSDAYEATPTFSPDGRELYFFRADTQFRNYRLLVSTCEAGRWTSPRPPSFAAPSPITEADPHLTADGRRLYYVSSRQSHAATGGEDLDIWYVDRASPTAPWGEPTRLPEPVSSPGSELLPRRLDDGRLVFGSNRPGGHGESDIYAATPRPDGTWTVANLGPAINSAASEYEAAPTADGRSLVVVSDRSGRSHLYRHTLGPDGWSPPRRLAGRDDVFQVGPVLSPRADRMLFAQADGARSGELFLADLVAAPDPSWPPRCR
jgi:Tol biopolymer transport system component